MKTPLEFFENAKHAAIRLEEANKPEHEADYREKRIRDFKQKSLERSKNQRRKSQDILSRQKEKAEQVKAQREYQKELSAKRSAKTTAQLKSAVKGAYKTGKSLLDKIKDKRSNS
jgi:hypothetical protein